MIFDDFIYLKNIQDIYQNQLKVCICYSLNYLIKIQLIFILTLLFGKLIDKINNFR